MKQIYLTLTLLFFSLIAIAQTPAGYYDSATGSGYTLKTQLKEIIDANNDGLATEYQSTDNGYAGLYTTFANSDIDLYYENNGTLLDMYSENPSGIDSYEYTYGTNQDDGSGGTSEGEKYNREHIIPQSVFNSNSPMKNDAHFVVPSDKYVNAQRGNLPFGVVQTPNYTSSNGSKRGNNLNSGYSAGYASTVFEPIDEFKGDIARMYFYFATRYEDDIASFTSYDMFINNSSDQVFDITFLNILYQWHTQDPVSTREIDRNNAIFNSQNNRNPFIDNPSYVENIWSTLLSTENFTKEDFQIYPNPVKNNILYVKTKQNVDYTIYDVLGKKVLKGQLTKNNSKINLSTINKGVYIIQLKTRDESVTKKVVKQ